MIVTTVAKRYANALYGFCKEKSIVENVLKELEALTGLYENSDDFRELVKNPLIKRSEKERVFDSLEKDGMISNVLKNFLYILTEKNRLQLIVEVYEHFRYLYMEDKGEVDAAVKIADEYSDDLIKEIAEALSKVTGKKVNLNLFVDKEIIGGFVAQVKSNLYDVSVKGQLNKLEEKLLQV